MAKGNPFLGTVSGSFGDLTLKNYRGKQVLTRKSTNPHNPRTSKQIYQRMFFATVGKARAALKNIIDHSFEQVPHGVDSLNYFQKRNIALLREGTVYDYGKQTWVNPNMNFVAPKSSTFSINPYRISEGSLPSLTNFASFLNKKPNSWFDYEATPEFSACIPWFINFAQTEQQEKKPYVIIEENLQSIGAKKGDFLTCVFFTALKDDIDYMVPYQIKANFVRFKICEFRFNGKTILSMVPSNVNGDNLELPDVFDEDVEPEFATFLVASRSSDAGPTYWNPYLNVATSSLMVDYSKNDKSIDHNFGSVIDQDGEVVLAATWILSRPENDMLLISTQDIILANRDGNHYPLNLSLESAFDLWTKQGKAIGDARYLLEGGDV